jgi:hypothetical protein
LAGWHTGTDGETTGSDDGVTSAVAVGDGDSMVVEGDADPVGAVRTTGAVPHAVKIKTHEARVQMAGRTLV